MAPSFLKDFSKDLRRRSRASFRTERSTDRSTGSSSASNGTVPTTKSSSTLNSTYGSQTPPSAVQSSNCSTNMPTSGTQGDQPTPLPVRPQVLTTNNSSKRQSVSGMSGLGSPSSTMPSTLPTSPFAPRITSIADGTWVQQKVLLLYGVISDPATQAIDGQVTISRTDDGFPPVDWPVCDSKFKALAYLHPGPNRLRFDFASPKVANSNTNNPIHSSYLTIHMVPALTAPPLDLVILLGKDSEGTFDAVPARIEREGNGLDTAIRKYRMAAQLWQAFTSEQMIRNKMGRRTFRFEEEWQTGTLSGQDRERGIMRNEPKIHIIRSDKTVAEIRDLDVAQQNKNAKRSGDLFSWAQEAVKQHFSPLPGQKRYVSVLILDSHWDNKAKILRGHAALGGGSDDLRIAIFGSHALQSYPSCIEDVAPAFSDCTPSDTNFVANDCNESGSSWEAANIGIGAHLHEVGHLLGCPHQESGIMLRDYVIFNRTFTSREPFSTRTKSKGGPVIAEDECGWHRLDVLRFRSHPCFKLNTDLSMNSDKEVQVWPIGGGSVVATATTGISFIEIFADGNDVCKVWNEYPDGLNGGPVVQRQINLVEEELRARLPEDKKKSAIKLVIHSFGGGYREIADFRQLASKVSSLKLANGKIGFRGGKLGHSQLEGSLPQEVIIESIVLKNKMLTHLRVYHGSFVDGIEFFYEDTTSQLFGKRGGTPGGTEFSLDTRRGETILGFHVRAGAWIDSIQILTSNGRRSEVFGNQNGGSGHTLIPPRGYICTGISGSCGPFIDGFSLIISR